MGPETFFNKGIAGAPGRTRTRGPRFRKPMTHDSDSPSRWAYSTFRLTSSFFVFPPICVNLPHFVLIIVTNWSQDLTVLCGQKHLARLVWFESYVAPRTLHNTNPPQIIIKGSVINLANRKTKNLKNTKEEYNESKRTNNNNQKKKQNQ